MIPRHHIGHLSICKLVREEDIDYIERKMPEIARILKEQGEVEITSQDKISEIICFNVGEKGYLRLILKKVKG